MAVQSAVKMGLPPTSLLTDKQPSEGWSREDKKLAVALEIMQRETCPKCGQPLWICRSSERDLLFKVKVGLCYASAELERVQAKQTKDLKPGEYQYVVPYMIHDDTPLPSRADYLRSLADED